MHFSFQVQEYSQEIFNEASNPPNQADGLSQFGLEAKKHASCIPGDKKTLKCGFHAIQNELLISVQQNNCFPRSLTSYTTVFKLLDQIRSK